MKRTGSVADEQKWEA